MAEPDDTNRVRAWWQTGAQARDPLADAEAEPRESAWERAVNARRREREAAAQPVGERLIQGGLMGDVPDVEPPEPQGEPSRFERDDPAMGESPPLRGRFVRPEPQPRGQRHAAGGHRPTGNDDAAHSTHAGQAGPAGKAHTPNLYGDVISLSWSDLIPQADLALLHAPGSERARAYRALHSELAMRLKGDEGGRAIAVTSPDPGVGRSTVAANLAVAFARSGMRALLIEADFQRPRQLELFGANPVPGIGDWICGRDTLSGVVFEDLPGLTLIPAGRGGPGLVEKLAHPGFRRWLSRISGPELAVIIDTAAAQEAVESEAICAAAGGALLVSRRHSTDVRKAQRHTQRLAERGTAFFGAIVTG